MTSRNEATGMRRMGEGDRSSEFKAGRNRLVTAVNDWMDVMAAKRDGGEAVAGGIPIADKPRIVRTVLGRTATGFRSLSEESQAGVALIGDGVTRPYLLQAVLPVRGRDQTTVIEAAGSDPLRRQFMEHEYGGAGSQQELIASFALKDSDGAGDSRYYEYEVRADGSVREKHLTPDGVNASRELRTPEDIAMASLAFEDITSQLA